MSSRKTEPKEVCNGGHSYNCNRMEHPKGREIHCYRCGTLMGCVWCCETARDLICLYCHNWATKIAVKYHGDVIPNHKDPNVNTDLGWRRYDPQIGSRADATIKEFSYQEA